jgi:hypothetical protein
MGKPQTIAEVAAARQDSGPSMEPGNMVAPETLTDEDFDMKGTSRKEYENEYYKRICSEIIDDFMYLGGDLVAKDEETLLNKVGITHVINCAADYSANYFQDKGVTYKSYHLKDHVRENIECVFYDAIQFILEARAAGGKIYVHCVQGISRSSTIICAYLIYDRKMTYNDAYLWVKERRQCANPNMTFIAQLICWHKRLYEPMFDSVPVAPRIFVVASHQQEDPQSVVARMLMENLYDSGATNTKVFDPRFMYVVQSKTQLLLWVGELIPKGNLAKYREVAEHHAQLLQKHEKAASKYQYVEQGSDQELALVWKGCFGMDKPPHRQPEIISEWNLWS